MSEYQPIACGLYDELETLAIRKERCLIDFVDEAGASQRVRSRIIDLFSRNKQEFAELENKVLIRLDRISRLNDAEVSMTCQV